MSSRSTANYYAVLGVPPSVTDTELRTAYRDLVKQHHPDRHRSYVQKVAATRRLQQINEAYGVLRDRVQRAAYNSSRNTSRPGPVQTVASRSSSRFERGWKAFFEADRFRWPRRIVGFILLAVAWTLAFLFYSQPPAPFARIGPDHWTRSLPVRIIMSTIAVPIVLIVGFAVLMTAVFMTVMPAMLIMMAFRAAWEKATHRQTTVRQELALLAVVLGVASFTVIGPHVRPTLLGVVITLVGWFGAMAAPAVFIEFVAMVAYQIWSRRVVASTNALVRA